MSSGDQGGFLEEGAWLGLSLRRWRGLSETEEGKAPWRGSTYSTGKVESRERAGHAKGQCGVPEPRRSGGA